MIEAGYWGLFFASFLAATILPFSSEAMLVAMLLAGGNVTTCIVSASVGNWLGSMTTYALGYIGDWRRISGWLKVKKESTDKYLGLAQKYGAWLGLFVWLPGIGDVIAICMGLMRTPVIYSMVLILIGKVVRYWIMAYLTLKVV